MSNSRQKPNINLNLEDESVAKLTSFTQFLAKNHTGEPNLGITLRVLECLIFIKLNSEWLSYCILNKNTDDSIYKYSTDKDKKALRAHNDMSFHIINYQDPVAAIKDYNIIITTIENKIDLLCMYKQFAKAFIGKILDSDIGCMEHRLNPALAFLVDPNYVKLNDLFEMFFANLRKAKIKDTDIDRIIPELLAYFTPHIGIDVAHQGKIFTLTWSDIKQFLANTYSYDDELKLQGMLDYAFITRPERGKYGIHFTCEAGAIKYATLFLMCLPNDLFMLTKDLFGSDFVENAKKYNATLEVTDEVFAFVLADMDSNFKDITIVESVDEVVKIAKDAWESEDVECFKAALAAYPPLRNLPIIDGRNALHLALLANNDDLICYLINALQVDVDATKHIQGNTTLLHLAASSNQIKPATFALLLKKTKNVNAKSNINTTPLFIAAREGNIEAVRLLLDHPNIDLDVNCTDDNITAETIARQNDYEEIANLLATERARREKEINDLTQEAREKHSFENYAITLRKAPTTDLRKHYLQEMTIFGKAKKTTLATPSEVEQIKTRKLWSDMVSETYEQNKRTHDRTKAQVCARIAEHFPNLDVESTYKACLQYVNDNTAITVTFHSKRLAAKGLTDFQLLNVTQQDNRNQDKSYYETREENEIAMFNFLSANNRQAYRENKHARPRYGALLLLDPNTTAQPVPNFGDSYILLSEAAKYNALFCAGNPFKHYNATKKAYTVCSAHHLEVLLAEWPLATFRAVVHRITTGAFPANFNQFDFSDDMGGYSVALLGPLNFLDVNLVEHIHIDPDYLKLTNEEIETFRASSITIDNEIAVPHLALRNEFFQAIKADDVNAVKRLLKTHPSLIKLADKNGYTAASIAIETNSLNVLKYFISLKCKLISAFKDSAFHLAASLGKVEALKLMLAENVDANTLDRSKRTALHRAAQNGHSAAVLVLINAKNADPNLRDNNDKTVIELAIAYCDSEACQAILNLPNFNRKRTAFFYLLTEAVHQNDVAKVTLILRKVSPKNLANNEGTSVLTAALQAEQSKKQPNKEIFQAIANKYLAAYILRTKERDPAHYNRTITFFKIKINLGFSAAEELAASVALDKVVNQGGDISELLKHQGALGDGELKTISRAFIK